MCTIDFNQFVVKRNVYLVENAHAFIYVEVAEAEYKLMIEHGFGDQCLLL